MRDNPPQLSLRAQLLAVNLVGGPVYALTSGLSIRRGFFALLFAYIGEGIAIFIALKMKWAAEIRTSDWWMMNPLKAAALLLPFIVFAVAGMMLLA
jgi:hypothetical protein